LQDKIKYTFKFLNIFVYKITYLHAYDVCAGINVIQIKLKCVPY